MLPHLLSVFLSVRDKKTTMFLSDGEVCSREQGAVENSHSLSRRSNFRAAWVSRVKKTVARIRERFAWKGIVHDVQQIVSFSGWCFFLTFQ